MIQINLVPDVKQELLRAQRQRSVVVSIAIITSIAFLAIVTVLAIYVYGVQAIRSGMSDNTIKSESEKLASVEDLSDTLTIQNQLTKLSAMHDDKQITSRLFDVLTTIDPPSPNNMTISNVDLEIEEGIITLEGFAVKGYSAVEMFKKTIEATKLEYKDGDENKSVNLAEAVNIEETSYGENSDGNRVLRFTISFEYSEDVFSRGATNARIVAPTRENVTDSFRRIPQSLFGDQAEDIKEDN